MTSLLREIRSLNGLANSGMAEPFAGGGGASLSLLFAELAPEVYLNDADESVFAFWWALTNRSAGFLSLLRTKRVSMTEWRRQRAIYRSGGGGRLARGFATFYLNRCNRSGIVMNGGPIGGIEQAGSWKIDARFNKEALAERCRKVFDYRDRIHLSRVDGFQAISDGERRGAFLFIDPPYYRKGPTLYLNSLTHEYHEALADHLRCVSTPWVLTYDDCEEIRALYRGWASIRPFRLRYVAARKRHGNEILITPKQLRLPIRQDSDALVW